MLTIVARHARAARDLFDQRCHTRAGRPWLKVRTPDDCTGGIQSAAQVEALFANPDWSKRFAGLPSLWGGASAQHITHTGRFIGNSQFLNATAYQHPIVQIDNLNDHHWTKLLVAARRIK